MSEKTCCLVFAANPYREVAVAEIGADGRLVTYRTRKGPRAPLEECVDVHFVHSSGGSYTAPAGAVQVLDPTPRSYDEACALARRCPRGGHVGPPLSIDAARTYLATLS